MPSKANEESVMANWCDKCGKPISVDMPDGRPICENCKRVEEENAMPRCDMCGKFTPREETRPVNKVFHVCNGCDAILVTQAAQTVAESEYHRRRGILIELSEFVRGFDSDCACELKDATLHIESEVGDATRLFTNFVLTLDEGDTGLFTELLTDRNMKVEAKTATMFEFTIAF